MPFSTRKAQCNLLISAELRLFILPVRNPHETSSTSTLDAPKILSFSVFGCPGALTMGWLAQGVAQGLSLPGDLQHRSPCANPVPLQITRISELMMGQLLKLWLSLMVFSSFFKILSLFDILVSIG